MIIFNPRKKQRFFPFFLVALFLVVFYVPLGFALNTQSPSSTILSPIDYNALQACLSSSNSVHYDYDTPGKLLACTTFCFSESPLNEKVSFLDFLLGQGADPLSKALKKLADKFHLDPNSETSRNILNNLEMTVERFVAKFRAGTIKGELPGELLKGTVRQALESGNSKIRKLLTSQRPEWLK